MLAKKKGVLSDVLTPMNKSALLLGLWRLAASAILTNSRVVPALQLHKPVSSQITAVPT